MESDASRDVRVAGNKFYKCMDFRLASRERPGAYLLSLLPPMARKVAIQVQTLFVGLYLNGVAIPVFQQALRKEPVVRPASFGWIAADEEPGLKWIRLPG